MPRDMTGTGRYPPQPRFAPFAFYSAVRLGDPEMLERIMAVDPYFVTQDNGAGAPIHFAVTYRQLDMVHHLLSNGGEVNQRDVKGFTPLHRAAYLAHLDGYAEIYEYLLSRGADPSLRTDDYDPYLSPGRKTPREVAVEDPVVQATLAALEKKYEDVPKAREPHPDVGDWWALYDYGLDTVKSWRSDYKHPYPEEAKRQRDAQERRKQKEAARARRDELLAQLSSGGGGAALTDDGAATAGGAASTVQTSSSSSASAAAAAGNKSNVAFLFPGQGSQAVGMMAAAAKLPAVQQMLQTAKKVLGYDLLDLCVSGPKEKLDETRYSQPALFVAGLAAVELARSSGAAAAAAAAPAEPAACAGLSLGEYCALVCAGALSFEDGLKVVKVRAESMAAAASSGDRPHGMLSVVGLTDDVLDGLVAAAAAKCGPGTICRVANYLFPTGRVVSGHRDALDVVQASATAAGALKAAPVAVSGAFHTPLMEPARQALAQVLESVAVSPPRFPVWSNVLGAPFPDDPAAIRSLLARQLVEPVQWEATLAGLLKALPAAATAGSSPAAGSTPPVPQMWELGPGQQVKAMVKRLDPAAWKALRNVAP